MCSRHQLLRMDDACVRSSPACVAGKLAAAGLLHSRAPGRRTLESVAICFARSRVVLQTQLMRSLYSQMLPAMAVLLFATTEPVRAQVAKNKVAPVIPHYDPPDQPFRMAPMPQSTRSIVVPLATNLHLAFDTALLRTHTVWSGKGLALLGPQYGLPKSPFISTNDGTVLWTMPPVFPWAVAKARSYPAKLPERAAFRGVWVADGAVVFDYDIAVGNAVLPVKERVRLEWFGETPAVVRRFELGGKHPALSHLAFAGSPETPIAFGGGIAFVLGQPGGPKAEVAPKRRVTVVHTRADERVRMFGGPEYVDYTVEVVTEAGSEKGHSRNSVKGPEFRIWLDIPADLPWFELIATVVPDSATERKFSAEVAALTENESRTLNALVLRPQRTGR